MLALAFVLVFFTPSPLEDVTSAGWGPDTAAAHIGRAQFIRNDY